MRAMLGMLLGISLFLACGNTGNPTGPDGDTAAIAAAGATVTGDIVW